MGKKTVCKDAWIFYNLKKQLYRIWGYSSCPN